jgi:hypothetical protein
LLCFGYEMSSKGTCIGVGGGAGSH